jgi:hypothetical protein
MECYGNLDNSARKGAIFFSGVLGIVVVQEWGPAGRNSIFVSGKEEHKVKCVSSTVIKPACVELCDSIHGLDISIFFKLLYVETVIGMSAVSSHVKDI